jgi:UDP-N-acetylmuramoyl-tripeptide--D-alanyl-D-alanine ligase
MIALSLGEIATIVGGTVDGDSTVVVTAPTVVDSRRAGQGALFVAFSGERVDGRDGAGHAAAVAVLGTRPMPLPSVVVRDTTTALQALAAHVVDLLRERLTVVGLTGSQGTTDTTNLLTAVLSTTGPTIATTGTWGDDLGLPLTLLRADRTTRYLVLEIADIAGPVRPDIAVVLDAGIAHLGSHAAVAQARSEVVRELAPGRTAVLNADDPRVTALRTLTDGPVLTFGHAENADVQVTELRLDRLGRPSFTLRTAQGSARVRLRIVGAHQAVHAAAAAATGLAAGVPVAAAAAALATAVPTTTPSASTPPHAPTS